MTFRWGLSVRWNVLVVVLAIVCSSIRPSSAQAGVGVAGDFGAAVGVISAGIMGLLAASGKNIRSLKSPIGCLDGGFGSDYTQVVGVGYGGFTGESKCSDVVTPCAFTIGYWDTCPGNTPWQKWQMTEGKLYCAMGGKCWGANRCMDAFAVTERSETIACGFSCWGGNGQELTAQFAQKRIVGNAFVGEPLFSIRPRMASNRCLTYIGDQNPVRFRPCEDSDDQLWFIPGELPEAIKAWPAPGADDAGRRLKAI